LFALEVRKETEMSREALLQSSYTCTLSGEERENLLRLLRERLGEARVEAHRTHTPAFRELVFGEEAVTRSLIEKLEQAHPDLGNVTPKMPAGIEEGWPVPDVIYIDEEGRFQMPTEELQEFVGFLRDNGVRVEAESANVFQACGKPHGYGRLLHRFDSEFVNRLYRVWKPAQASRS
jgi:hypothetical protein